MYFKMNFLLVFFIFISNFLFSEEQTIGIYTYYFEGLPAWDADSVKKGIPGSEEAVIYLSESLAKLGFKVIVFGYPPKDSPHKDETANPRYLHLNQWNEIKNLDVAIACRNPFISMMLKNKAKQVFLWPHDTPPSSPLNSTNFDEVIWISKWQREQWINYNQAFEAFKNIYGNGIVLEQFEKKEKEIKNVYSCIYGSNYARGLEILLDIWPEVKNNYLEATLDIYYGWQTWGLLSDNKISEMKKKLDDLKNMDVNEHGMVSHQELNEAYRNASLWTYPCIAPETFCITAIKAQYCGAIPVIIDGSALKETVRYGFRTNEQHNYLQLLLKAMSEIKNISNEDRNKMQKFIEEEYTWDKIALKLKNFIESNQSLTPKK